MKKTLFFYIALLFATPLFAQDAENCEDHPLVSRMPGFYLAKCEESFNEIELLTGADKTQMVEGTVFNYEYYISDGAKLPSRLQILRNYENALVKNGAERIYFQSRDAGNGTLGATFRLGSGEHTYWFTFTYFNGSESQCDGYFMSVVRVEGMVQEITASEMFDKVNAGTPLALYINFETGKSAIKSESQGIINELHSMLKDNASVKISIEGHTDNVGNAASNKTLSEQRAASVKGALVAKGIAAERLKSVGFGQDQPIADNATEEGRAKNRRVEIRKQW